MTATPTTQAGPVSPEQLRELAARAEVLRRDVAAVWAAMRAADEATGYAGARLDDVVDELRRIGELFDDTLVDLNRIHGRPRCPVAWGICATDGRSLVESDGGTDCTGDCGQHWEHLRLSEPCREPVEYMVRQPDGTTSQMCIGHAKDAEENGASITDLTADE